MSKIKPEEAAERFVDMLISEVYEAAVEVMISSLEKPPPGQKPLEERIRLYEWFQSLEKQDRRYVREVIKEAADATLFLLLATLDGTSGFTPLEDQASDFAIYLQAYEYEDEEYMIVKEDSPLWTVRVNTPAGASDLHDHFSAKLRESAAAPSSIRSNTPE